MNMVKPQGMNDNDFARKMARGEFDRGHHAEGDRGPDHPSCKLARDMREAGASESEIYAAVAKLDAGETHEEAAH